VYTYIVISQSIKKELEKKRERKKNYNEIYHLTPARMTTLNKSTNNKCWRGWGEKGIILLVEIQSGATTMENSMEFSQKI
jgi:hypothetical protein